MLTKKNKALKLKIKPRRRTQKTPESSPKKQEAEAKHDEAEEPARQVTKKPASKNGAKKQKTPGTELTEATGLPAGQPCGELELPAMPDSLLDAWC